MTTNTPLKPLVYSRRDVRQLLRCSDGFVRLLEQRRHLTPVRLGVGTKGVRYVAREVERLAGAGVSAAEK